MRRPSPFLKRGDGDQRAAMLSRLGIGEAVVEEAPAEREPLLSYHPRANDRPSVRFGELIPPQAVQPDEPVEAVEDTAAPRWPRPVDDLNPEEEEQVRLRAEQAALAQAAALAALADADYVEESRLLNQAGVAQLTAGLEGLGVRYVPSHANFVLAKVGAASEVNTALLKQGVIVRPVANYGLPEWLRITVGLPEENTRFITALAKALKG